MRSLNPYVDIDTLLAIEPKKLGGQPVATERSSDSLDAEDESSPAVLNGYEWHEDPLPNDTVDAIQDGMASLSTASSEAGYLGSATSSLELFPL